MMNMEVRAMDNNEYGFNNMNGEIIMLWRTLM